jgi:hypothetical protein
MKGFDLFVDRRKKIAEEKVTETWDFLLRFKAKLEPLVYDDFG